MDIFQELFGGSFSPVAQVVALTCTCLGLYVASRYFSASRSPASPTAKSKNAKPRRRKKNVGVHESSELSVEEEHSPEGVSTEGAQTPESPSLQSERPTQQEARDGNISTASESSDRIAKLMAKKAERKARKARESLEERAQEIPEKSQEDLAEQVSESIANEIAPDMENTGETVRDEDIPIQSESMEISPEHEVEKQQPDDQEDFDQKIDRDGSTGVLPELDIESEQPTKIEDTAPEAYEEEPAKEQPTDHDESDSIGMVPADEHQKIMENEATRTSELVETEIEQHKQKPLESKATRTSEPIDTAMERHKKKEVEQEREPLEAKESTSPIGDAKAMPKRTVNSLERPVGDRGAKNVLLGSPSGSREAETNDGKSTCENVLTAQRSHRSALEREILKVTKKLREVDKLREKIAAGENLEPNQLEKVSKAESLSDLLGELQLQQENEKLNIAEEVHQQQQPAFFPAQEEQAFHGVRIFSNNDMLIVPSGFTSFQQQHAPPGSSTADESMNQWTTRDPKEFRNNKKARGSRKQLSSWVNDAVEDGSSMGGHLPPLQDNRDGWMVSLDGMPRNVKSLIQSDCPNFVPSSPMSYMEAGEPQNLPWMQVGPNMPQCFPADMSQSQDFQCCWDWLNHGTCHRGDTCRWEHPTPGPTAIFWDNEHNSIYPKCAQNFDFTNATFQAPQ